VSESPFFIPPYVSASRRAESPLSGMPNPPGPEFDPDDDSRSADRPVREGLPAHYRMRAEPHYVEALARPRAEAPVTPGPATGEARVKVPGERAIGAASDTLSKALESINASLAEVRGHGRPLRERLLLELARAEAVRAGWLADAIAVLQREPLPGLDQVDLSAVVARVTDALGPEQRVTGQAPSIEGPESPMTVFADERLLTVAVGGIVQALTACLDGRDQAAVHVRVTSLRDGVARAVEVSQGAVRMSAQVIGRLFETDWDEHPGGATGAVLLAAARRIATLQGGMLEAKALDAGGCRLVLALPAAG
jgi:hypothetical protein